jgi:hypothetical protein
LGVKLLIWLLTTKSQELLWFTYVRVLCHILCESSWWRLQLFLDLISIGNLHKKWWDLQSCGNPNFGNFETFNLGVLGQNDIWMQAPWPSIKNTIRRKVLASPQFMLWWVLWVHVCSWLVHAPKVLQLCTNQLVIWFMQVCVNNWPICHSSWSPSQSSNTPFYPQSATS